jgi:hypothetical protein
VKVFFHASEYTIPEQMHIIISPETFNNTEAVCHALQQLINQLKKIQEPEE